MGTTGSLITGSGSYDFNMQRDDIIKAALRLIGVLKKDETPSAPEIENASQSFNRMLKSWQAEDIGLWLITEARMYTSPGTESYSLGLTGDNATLSAVETEIETATSSGDSTIDVDSITGMTDGDYIGIELDDGTLQWTTINGSPSGNTITLTTVLTDDVAVDNQVYTYTGKIQRPMEVISARLRNKADDETPLNFYTRDEYFRLTSKDDTGQINHVFYDKQLTNGVFYVYPTGTLCTDRIMLTLKYPVEDIDSAGDYAEFPNEWLDVITYNLAVKLFYEYPNDDKRIDINTIHTLRKDARELKELLKNFDTAQGPYQFCPDVD